MTFKLRYGLLFAALTTLAGCSPTDTPEHSNDATALAMTVYKSPTCGCCNSWIDYLREEGFSVDAVDRDDMDSVKASLGLTAPELKSCHTGVIDGYLIEGHVPANDIMRLLRERPTSIAGLSAPGMPMLSPGMGSREPKDYAVLSFTKKGEASVYSQY